MLSLVVSEMVNLSLELQMAIFSLCRNASKIKSAPRKAALRWRETQIPEDNPVHLHPPPIFQFAIQ